MTEVSERREDPQNDLDSLPDRSRKNVSAVLIGAALIILAYWTLWAVHRSAVASSSTHSYVVFEDAFPAADFLLVALMVLGAWSVITRRATALLWLLLGAGGGLYLFCMDVLYDLQHGVWGAGPNGLVELGINVLTLALSLFIGSWAWRHRQALLDGS